MKGAIKSYEYCFFLKHLISEQKWLFLFKHVCWKTLHGWKFPKKSFFNKTYFVEQLWRIDNLAGKMTLFRAIFYWIRTFHNCGMNWDKYTKKCDFMKKNTFFMSQLHNCIPKYLSILQFFMCVLKYLTIEQFLPNSCLTFPAGNQCIGMNYCTTFQWWWCFLRY